MAIAAWPNCQCGRWSLTTLAGATVEGTPSPCRAISQPDSPPRFERIWRTGLCRTDPRRS